MRLPIQVAKPSGAVMNLYLKSRWVSGAAVLGLAVNIGHAQPPTDIESALVKIGPIVDPVCTAKLYRPLMPKNDINSTVTPLYPGITVARDVSFGPDPMDIVDVFSADKGPDSRPVLLYVPGGAANLPIEALPPGKRAHKSWREGSNRRAEVRRAIRAAQP